MLGLLTTISIEELVNGLHQEDDLLQVELGMEKGLHGLYYIYLYKTYKNHGMKVTNKVEIEKFSSSYIADEYIEELKNKLNESLY